MKSSIDFGTIEGVCDVFNYVSGLSPARLSGRESLAWHGDRVRHGFYTMEVDVGYNVVRVRYSGCPASEGGDRGTLSFEQAKERLLKVLRDYAAE